MKDLNYQLKQLCYQNRDGSYSTQSARRHILNQVSNQLHELGYRGMNTRSLKPKHVEALVEHWLANDIGLGTIKNRMTCLRWWAAAVNRSNVVARSNDYYGIPNRQFVATESKATSIEESQLSRVRDPYVRMSLELQRDFGLRREEAIKFRPDYADRGDHIELKQSWTKGGKARVIPILTDEQRATLKKAHQLAGKSALIPGGKNYIQQLRVYERQTANAGMSRMHGLRHAYAQARYLALTGWHSPAAGGPSSAQLSAEDKKIDREARLIISGDLGHIREQITSVYLGR